MRELDHPTQSQIELDAVLAALADPVRRSIVAALSDNQGDMICREFDLPVTKSTQTHHFRVLRQAGIIQQEYRGACIYSRLRANELDARFPGLLPAILAAR